MRRALALAVPLLLVALAGTGKAHNGVEHETGGPVQSHAPGLKLKRVAAVKGALYAVNTKRWGLLVASGNGRVYAQRDGRRSVVVDLGSDVPYSLAVKGSTLYVFSTQSFARVPSTISAVNLKSLRRRAVLSIPTPVPGERNGHFGGQVAIGPGGELFVSTGDGGNSKAPDPYGAPQDPRNPYGKLLEVDPASGAWTVWGMGLRNPFRFSIEGGSILVADVGHDRMEEMTRVDLAAKPPVNFGWSYFEGTLPFRGESPTSTVPPTFEILHSRRFCSITGGTMIRARSLPGLRGRYVFGDYCGGDIRSVRLGDERSRSTGLRLPELVALSTDRAGSVYAVSMKHGVYRLGRSR